jgi:hypothetical protein
MFAWCQSVLHFLEATFTTPTCPFAQRAHHRFVPSDGSLSEQRRVGFPDRRLLHQERQLERNGQKAELPNQRMQLFM